MHPGHETDVVPVRQPDDESPTAGGGRQRGDEAGLVLRAQMSDGAEEGEAAVDPLHDPIRNPEADEGGGECREAEQVVLHVHVSVG